MTTPVLWHIPLSHYSEKARWALDYKGIAHERHTLGADYLIRCWRATRQGKLPILWLDGRAIADSTRIIAALEARFPEPALYPAEPSLREQALALEDELDEGLGPALRAVFIGPLFRHDPDLAVKVLTSGWPKAYQRIRPLLPLFPMYYRFRHKMSDANLEADRATVARALDRLEAIRRGGRYLVGDTFTVADLTAAALLSPLSRPPELQYPRQAELPAVLEEYRAALMRHPAMEWANGIYRRHRGRSAEIPRPRRAAA